MLPEELLKMLREGGMDDEAVVKLLNDALDVLNKSAEGAEEAEEDEKARAGKLLGVTL